MPALSVVVPTYNESGNIHPLVGRIVKALGGVDFELIVVDDSTDGTERILQELARDAGYLRIVHRLGRRGLASAVADGIALALGDVVCVLDADLQHPPEAVPALVDALERTHADLAIASRYIPGGGYQFTAARRAVSRVATTLARILLTRARSISDPVSGFFAFRRSVVGGVRLRPIGYKILLEILVRGRVSRVVEVPYRFQARHADQSKLTMRQNLAFVRHLLALWMVQAPPLKGVTHAYGDSATQP
jgi:dolichol-phosphate mannosyltransferase